MAKDYFFLEITPAIFFFESVLVKIIVLLLLTFKWSNDLFLWELLVFEKLLDFYTLLDIKYGELEFLFKFGFEVVFFKDFEEE